MRREEGPRGPRTSRPRFVNRGGGMIVNRTRAPDAFSKGGRVSVLHCRVLGPRTVCAFLIVGYSASICTHVVSCMAGSNIDQPTCVTERLV